mmetsp:Transcript_11080/g.31800  ORF Transcript_11080/g.31800 Transcript_11080/m.31800 type:complete len:291 (+) Transcript_11080:707-1579(+)
MVASRLRERLHDLPAPRGHRVRQLLQCGDARSDIQKTTKDDGNERLPGTAHEPEPERTDNDLRLLGQVRQQREDCIGVHARGHGGYSRRRDQDHREGAIDIERSTTWEALAPVARGDAQGDQQVAGPRLLGASPTEEHRPGGAPGPGQMGPSPEEGSERRSHQPEMQTRRDGQHTDKRGELRLDFCTSHGVFLAEDVLRHVCTAEAPHLPSGLRVSLHTVRSRPRDLHEPASRFRGARTRWREDGAQAQEVHLRAQAERAPVAPHSDQASPVQRVLTASERRMPHDENLD